MRAFVNKRLALLVALAGLLAPRLSLALPADAGEIDPASLQMRIAVMLTINIISSLALTLSFVLLPTGIFICVRNLKKDRKRFKRGIWISAISAIVIVVLFGFYLVSSWQVQ